MCVFVGKGLVYIFVFSCVSYNHFGFVLLVLLGLFFSVPSQEIGLEERFQNDLFCVEWEVKPYSVHPPGKQTDDCFVIRPRSPSGAQY